MNPTQLRRKLEQRLGRPLNVSDARLADLIAAARTRPAPEPVADSWPPPRRLPNTAPVPRTRGQSDARWSNDALDYPLGIDRTPAESAEARRLAEKRAAVHGGRLGVRVHE